MPFASRAGEKLEHALKAFGIDPAGWVCADLGCSTGGFTDCLLQHGAARVYAVDTGYGVLDYNLRKDPRVIVMERTNAMHVSLPEPVQLVTIDVSWTRQRNILPHARELVSPGGRGRIITLIKPHYEADPALLHGRGGVLPDEHVPAVIEEVSRQISQLGLAIAGTTTSPIRGSKGNREVLALLMRADESPSPPTG